jgi:hypothetical protein
MKKYTHFIIGLLIVVLLIGVTTQTAVSQEGEWLLSGSWSRTNRHRHEVIVSQGPGLAKQNPSYQATIAPNPGEVHFGLSLSSGRIDLIFRASEQGHYRVVFDLTSVLSIRLEEVSSDGTVTLHDEEMVPNFDVAVWHDVRIMHRVDSDEGKVTFNFTCQIDGLQVCTSTLSSGLSPGTIYFESYNGTNALIDVKDDPIDLYIEELRNQPFEYGKHLYEHFIATNRDTFAQLYDSLGRPPVLVQMRRDLFFTYTIAETDLQEQNYVLPRILANGVSPPLFTVNPEDLSRPFTIVQPATRPIIHSITPYELNTLNNPADSTFSIYGVNLGEDQATVFLGRPTSEYRRSEIFGVQTLRGDEARRAPGNTEGLDLIQRITVDLKKLASWGDPTTLPMEGPVEVWVLPDYETPYFSNRAEIYLMSRWESERMIVAYARRFRIREDEAGGLDGIPEQYWSFAGSTTNAATEEELNTKLHFPFQMSAPWSAEQSDWLPEIPIFAARFQDLSKALKLGLTGFESDQGGGGDVVVKLMTGLGKATSKAGTVGTIVGEILQTLGTELRPSDDPFGALALKYQETEPEQFGIFVEPGLRGLEIGGETKVYAEVDVKRVDAPYIQSVTVRVKRYRWTNDPFNPNPFMSGDLDLYLVARAATRFEGEHLSTGRNPGLRTPEHEVVENEWIDLVGDDQIVLEERFDGDPIAAPFLYLEFAIWDADSLSDDDNLGGPYTKILFFGEPEMNPHEAIVRGSDKIRLRAVGFGNACEIEYEFEIEKWTGPVPPIP